MKTPLLIYGSISKNSFLKEFINQIQDFEIVTIQDINNKTHLKIIISYNVEKTNAEQFIYWCDKNLTAEATIFCSKKLIQRKILNKINFIYYPLKISDFKKNINTKINNSQIKYFNLALTNNKLINNSNTTNVMLTDTEEKLLRLLFVHHKIERIEFERKVLNFVDGVESKSLDSHLARIRKKFIQINANINISSVDSKYIVLDSLSN